MCGIAAFGFKSGVPEAAQQWLKDSVISLHHRGSDDRWLMSELTVGATRDSAHDDYRADFGASIHRGPLT